MFLNKFVRSSIMLAFVVTIFTVLDVNATANGINSNDTQINNDGYRIFPNNPIVYQSEVSPYPILKSISVNGMPSNVTFQAIDRESHAVPWWFISKSPGVIATTSPALIDFSSIFSFPIQTGNERIAVDIAQVAWRQSIQRLIEDQLEIATPQQGGMIDAIAKLSTFREQLGAAPLAQRINDGDRGFIQSLPVLCNFRTVEPNVMSIERKKDLFPDWRISHAPPPIIQFAPLEGAINLNPATREEVKGIESTRIEQIDVNASSIAPIQATIDDISALSAVSPAEDTIQENTPASEIDGKGHSIFEAKEVPNDIEENILSGIDQDIFLYAQASNFPISLPLHDQVGFQLRIAKGDHRRNNGSKKSVDSQNQDMLLTDVRTGSTEDSDGQPFIPFKIAGDNFILSGVLFNEYGKTYYKSQRRVTEISFVMSSITYRNLIPDKGDAHELRQCSRRPRAPTVS